MMFGTTESERPTLTNREVIFEKLQPMWSQSTNVIDRRTDGRTTCDRKTALCTVVHRAVKTTIMRLSEGERHMSIGLTVLTTLACDGRTDKQTDGRTELLCQ